MQKIYLPLAEEERDPNSIKNIKAAESTTTNFVYKHSELRNKLLGLFHHLTLAIVGGDPVINSINLLDEVLIDFVEHFLRELLGGCVQQQADNLSA